MRLKYYRKLKKISKNAHDLCAFEKLFPDQNFKCPNCGSNIYIKNGKDKTVLRRFICKIV